MLKKILISICIILAILNIFQYTLISKNKEFVAKQQLDLIYDLRSNLIQVISHIDNYNETKDDKSLGATIVELRELSERITWYRGNYSLDNLPVNIESSELFTYIRRDLSEYSEINKTIDLNALKEGVQYLIDKHHIIQSGRDIELHQLVQDVVEIIYGTPQ